jgi:hypothetical protein
MLRSWVPLPPGPFLPSSRIRYYFEFDLGYCRTNSAAMLLTNPIEKEVFDKKMFDTTRFRILTCSYSVQYVIPHSILLSILVMVTNS